MKKISFFAVATLAVVLMGCSSKNTNNPTFDTTKLWPAKQVQGEKWGFIDAKGNFAIPAMYDEVSNFSCGYALVYVGDAPKFIDTNNKMLTTPSMDDAYDFYNKYAKIYVDGKYGLLDNSGKATIQPFFYRLGYMGDNGLIGGCVGESDMCGYYDKDGKVVLTPMYNTVGMFEDGAAVVVLNDKYGVIDKDGKWLISAMYDGLDNLGHGLIGFSQNGKYGVLNLKGETVIQPIYKDFQVPVDNDLIAVTMDGEKWGFVDFKGNQVIQPMYVGVTSFFEGYACVIMSEEGPATIIDTKGNVVLTLAKNEYPATGLHNGLFMTVSWNESETSYEEYYKYMDIKGSVVYTWSEEYDYYAPKRHAMEDHGKAFIEKTLR